MLFEGSAQFHTHTHASFFKPMGKGINTSHKHRLTDVLNVRQSVETNANILAALDRFLAACVTTMVVHSGAVKCSISCTSIIIC